MQKPASQIFREAAKIYGKDSSVLSESNAIAKAIGMSDEEFDRRFDNAYENSKYTAEASLSVIADFLEEQEEYEEIFKPSYDELYNAAIERLARIYDDAIIAHVKLRTKNVLDLVQYKEFQSEKAFVISIFNKNVMEVMNDVRVASRLLEFYF